jgi:hypothetical protein
MGLESPDSRPISVAAASWNGKHPSIDIDVAYHGMKLASTEIIKNA